MSLPLGPRGVMGFSGLCRLSHRLQLSRHHSGQDTWQVACLSISFNPACSPRKMPTWSFSCLFGDLAMPLWLVRAPNLENFWKLLSRLYPPPSAHVSQDQGIYVGTVRGVGKPMVPHKALHIFPTWHSPTPCQKSETLSSTGNTLY